MGGWGATRTLRLGERPSPQDSSKILRHAVLQIQSNPLCTNKTTISYNATITFFAGDGKGKSDTCQGDSGGPFVREIRKGRQMRWLVIGIVSWGEGCAQRDKYVYYTREYPFLDWINRTIEGFKYISDGSITIK